MLIRKQNFDGYGQYSKLLALLVCLLIVVALGGCGSSSETFLGGQSSQPPITKKSIATSVPLTIKDGAFDAPASIPAGWVDITVVNQGMVPHDAVLARLHDDVILSQLKTDIHKQPNAIFSEVSFVGGASTLQPGGSQEVLLYLTPGQYIVIGFEKGGSRVFHVMEDMMQTFIVAQHENWQRGKAPAYDDLFTLKDFTFLLPSEIRTGLKIFKVTNQGARPHEFSIYKLAAGETAQNEMNYLQAKAPLGPPPATPLGGMATLDTNASGLLVLNLNPGNYLALCRMPDATYQKPGYLLGMITSFTVKA